MVSARLLDRRLYPYAFVERNKVIANASANIIDLRWQGEPRRYIQIGTVMTEPDHRNKGISRPAYPSHPAGLAAGGGRLLLFANPTTVDFYPKFGFTRSEEHQYIMPVSRRAGDFRKLDMDSADDVALLRHYYEKSTRSHRCGWSITLAC